MNLRDMRYVVAVAEELHFGRAANRCHVSQPALSGQIRKLEAYLGVALFERTNRAVQVTPVGKRIVERAQQLISLADDIVATARSASAPLSGPFRLGLIATICPYLSPLILPAIRQEMPKLSLTVVEGMTADLEGRVADGELDAALLATAPVDLRLQDIVLYHEPFWLALSDEHRLAGRETIDLAELAPEEILLLQDGHCLRDQVLEVCHLSTGAANSNTQETSLETLMALVAAGEGVTLAPAMAKPGNDRRFGKVVMRPEASGTAGRLVRLVCRGSFPRMEIINGVASIIAEQVPEAEVGIRELPNGPLPLP